MKYIGLGYIEPGKFENMSESERNTMLDECFSYNDELRKNGHLVAEEPLQPRGVFDDRSPKMERRFRIRWQVLTSTLRR
jgi:hypothetical protein